MPLDLEDAHRAGQLLQWGLRPRSRPAQEPEYQELIERYLDHAEFRLLVREIARGLGMIVLDAGEHGIVVGPSLDSVFALKPADFRNQPSADDRLLDGLVQLAIAATIFPRARDFEEDATYARPPVTVDEVEETLRRLAELIEEEHRGKPDPVASDEESGLNEAWRVYHRRLAAMETRDDRKAQRATRRVIEFGLDRLRDFGCFTREIRNGQSLYQPTWRYQVLVKELAATTVYREVQHALENRTRETPKED
jgi:hypothetical protein